MVGALVGSGTIVGAVAAPEALAELPGRPILQISLTPPQHHHSAALGIAEVLQKGTVYSLAVVVKGVKPIGAHTRYTLWLRHAGHLTRLVGFIAPVPDHPQRLRAVKRLGHQLWGYGTLLVTREIGPHPKRPGQVILRGSFCTICTY
jgi:hypothetical protein